ncbi:hypothetical protein [Streptomyces sp. NPDC060187]|uniref:hypothetical protein n=1 Tax=Streptomyces sp. NPDC060187 TaxID=3347067 RepID=UPI003647AF21
MNTVVIAVEGISDEGAVRSILRECGLSVGMVQGKGGKSALLKKLPSYNQAAKFMPWFVLVDMDSADGCVVASVREWLPLPEDMMVFRVAVAEIESWLLADREAIADFLGISVSKIPRNPDSLQDPKQEIINLARKSRRRDIREGLVPRPNSGASVGPTYASDIRDFGLRLWRPRIAADESPSLARCLQRVEELAITLAGR